MQTEAYQALRESAGVFDLSGRGHLRVTGEDRARLLHAMTTNHIQALQPGAACYAFFLNAQGKVLADVNVIATETSLLLDLEAERAQPMYEHLDRFIIADDAEVTNLTDHVSVIALEGPQAPAVMERMGIDAPEEFRWVDWRTWVVAGLSATGERGFRFFMPRAEGPGVMSWIAGAGATMASFDEWNVVRLERGVPRYGVDITEREIPHETRLVEHAVSFSKGCYLGQEIVERVRSRGHANRALVNLLLMGHTAPAPRAKLSVDDQAVGEITSAAFSPSVGAVVALGYVRVEAIQRAVHFEVEGGLSAGLAGKLGS
ncbi:MAG: aminomethyl transferase family protein [Acidobacteria bacterium]|nr:aminomethyl transferase family protein [Acidobacteriota bacterium]